MVGDRHDVAIGIDGVQHCRCRAVLLAIFPVGPRPVGDLGIHGNGTDATPFGVVLEQGAGQAVDDLPVLCHEVDRLHVEPAGSPQGRQQLLFNAPHGIRGLEVTRPPADHVAAREAQSREERVADIEVMAVFADSGRHPRRAAKQPTIVGIRSHADHLYEIS